MGPSPAVQVAWGNSTRAHFSKNCFKFGLAHHLIEYFQRPQGYHCWPKLPMSKQAMSADLGKEKKIKRPKESRLMWMPRFPWPWGLCVFADQFNTVTCRYDSSQSRTRIEHVVCACPTLRERITRKTDPGLRILRPL